MNEVNVDIPCKSEFQVNKLILWYTFIRNNSVPINSNECKPKEISNPTSNWKKKVKLWTKV